MWQADIIATQLCPSSWTSFLCPPVFLHLLLLADASFSTLLGTWSLALGGAQALPCTQPGMTFTWHPAVPERRQVRMLLCCCRQPLSPPAYSWPGSRQPALSPKWGLGLRPSLGTWLPLPKSYLAGSENKRPGIPSKRRPGLRSSGSNPTTNPNVHSCVCSHEAKSDGGRLAV